MLTVLLTTLLSLPVQEEAQIGTWAFQQKDDPFGDASQCRIFTPSTDGKLGLMIRWLESTLEVIIGGRTPLRTNYDTGLADIRLRFDEDEPRRESWAISSNKTGVYAADVTAIIEEIRGANKLAFQATTLSGSMLTTVFEFKETEEALKVFNECRSSI